MLLSFVVLLLLIADTKATAPVRQTRNLQLSESELRIAGASLRAVLVSNGNCYVRQFY